MGEDSVTIGNMFDRAWLVLMSPDVEGGGKLIHDAGGATRWGISQRAYPSEDIVNMTEARAKQLARLDYWNACNCDRLPWWAALTLFDSAFNQGPGTARRLFQVAVKASKADGVIGPITVGLAHQIDAREGLLRYMSERFADYAKKDPASHRGWARRMFAVYEEARRP